MKYAKKLLTLGLSLALVLSLAACSGGDTAGGNTATPTPAGDNGGDVTNTEAPATEDPSSPKNWTSAADPGGQDHCRAGGYHRRYPGVGEHRQHHPCPL